MMHQTSCPLGPQKENLIIAPTHLPNSVDIFQSDVCFMGHSKEKRFRSHVLYSSSVLFFKESKWSCWRWEALEDNVLVATVNVMIWTCFLFLCFYFVFFFPVHSISFPSFTTVPNQLLYIYYLFSFRHLLVDSRCPTGVRSCSCHIQTAPSNIFCT